MAQVVLRINGHAYTVGCLDGEEAHLQAMADAVEQRIEKAKELGVQSGEARLLLMAALFMADELHDMGADVATLRKKVDRADRASSERAKSERMARLAARAEEIAGNAERH